MSIKKKLEAQLARFVGFEELLEAIAEADDVSAREAAIVLRNTNVLAGLPTYTRDPVDCEFKTWGPSEANEAVQHLLRREMDFGNWPGYGEPVPDCLFLVSIPDFGFWKDDVARALESAGITVPPLLTDWVQKYGQPAPASVASLQAELEAARARIAKLEARLATPTERAETTYLNIIGALLELVRGKMPTGGPHSALDSQSEIIDALVTKYPGVQGIAERTLQAKFAEAKRSLSSAR